MQRHLLAALPLRRVQSAYKCAGAAAGFVTASALMSAPRSCVRCTSVPSGSPVFEPVEVQKPATDYREYRTAMLPNNLRVTVVSDSKCDKSAAALSVKVGSIFDPREVPGLAHFCEHMLFLGTEKYPNEGEYNDYLAKNGGMSNAYTAETVTNYFFSVKPEALGGALDRFAQFFISPLFTEGATARELQAVDSEHSKNLQQDSWRQSQLLRSSVNPEHPLHHFMTGNSYTLRDAPKEQGVDVRAELLEFHKRYYSANLMQLVIVGREEPEELLALAAQHFAEIVNREASVPEDDEIGGGVEAFPPEHLARMVHVVPVSDVRSAVFGFVLPGQQRLWRSKPTNYLVHLLGHEGPGSLLAALKQRGLATELITGHALDEAGVHVFTVTVMLTEAGVDDLAAVGELLFAYVRLLREAGPNEMLWRELKQLSDLGFQFRSLSDSLSTASGLAHSLQTHEPAVALSSGVCVWDYEPALIQELTDKLTYDRLRLVVSNKACAERCNQAEHWYGTRFSDEPLDSQLKARWAEPGAVPDLVLPAPNPFVPEDLALRPSPSPGSHPPKPERLELNSQLSQVATAYFRKDEEFQLPKAACAFVVYCPFTRESLENRAITELWCLAVHEELNEFAYDAQMAGLSYSLQASPTGMTLSFGGYNDKLPQLVSAVARKMVSLVEVPRQSFSIVHTILERNLFNAATRSQPYQQAFLHEACLLQQPAHTYQQRLDVVKHLGPEALRGTANKLLGCCHVECLLQGNLSPDEAREIVRSFVEPLAISKPLQRVPQAGTAQLPPGWTLLERSGTNPDEHNGAAVVLLQAAEFSLLNQSCVSLASQVLSQRFFDDLRTKEQLGYIVSASSHGERHGFVGLRFIVQSEKPLQEVLQKIHDWVQGAWRQLAEQLTEAEFQEYRAALASTLRERPKSLSEEFSRNGVRVGERSFAFDHREKLLGVVEGLQLEEFQCFARERLATSPALCVLVRAARDESAIDVPMLGEGFSRRWSQEDVSGFRRDAAWRLRPDAVDTGMRASRL